MHRKLGFGFLRYPRTDPDDPKSVDYPLLFELVDEFLKTGSYFDTAYTYQNGFNEAVLRKALVERHPRETYRVADKLPGYMVKSHAHCWDFLNESLSRCGLTYFDVYLLHGLNEENYAIAEQLNQFGFLEEVKAAGKALKTGFSFHDSPELLDRILTAHPEVDYVQLQINYLDWESPSIQSRKCYEIAVKHGKPIIVMEPVKGGTLANPAEEAARILKGLEGESYASLALEFAVRLPQVELVLSGMNTLTQLRENSRPLSPKTPEALARWHQVLGQAANVMREKTAVPCTGCGYCLEVCPQNIPIPRLLALYNESERNPGEGWKMEYLYLEAVKGRGSVDDCVECGQCARRCPQKISIPECLQNVKKAILS